MLDACITHLGRLPSQLDLNNDQVRELLTYHRIHGKSQNVCRECVEEMQDKERTCFICSRTYTDKRGPKNGKAAQEVANMLAGTPKREKLAVDAAPEEQDAMRKAMIEKLKKAGVKILPD